MKRIGQLLGAVAALALAAVVGVAIFVSAENNAALGLTIKDIPLSEVEDGVYAGRYNGLFRSNAVEVTVRDHRIVHIRVTKKQLAMGEEEQQELISRVLRAQSPRVEAVARSSPDSKAFLKAVENALTSAVDRKSTYS